MVKASGLSGKLTSLGFSIGLEVKGVNFYLKLAAKSRNILTKKLFYSLAGEEVVHAQKIDEMYNMIKTGSKGKVSLPKNMPSVEAAIKDFFTRANKTSLKNSAGNTAGYELAMELEKKSYATYRDFSKKASSPEEKKFFEFLMQEEKQHLDAIVNVYRYLTEPGDWMMEEEGKVWNWMNT
ncbi:MAG: hypothetical protein A2204_02035 [Elusimicrobia bacterium RIFOXYA1_FULL_47_7]|nr:MAG: hypothetical protein A2278_06380 [Elusimicrobia bacterium RIFOXYA12_FULL_49_49]OGS09714.1 MAG: hypothetical protein A2204_02035 [Elusimicrobia bacterium RIFOXYA1_FULL_47_7]OGS10368.1 MAG: hypothetical protein A2386_04505 [Elusimicrobia bacterium RIFOXYB1_FULL_48_9]OGS16324.1 MAG: hypothetical protein A2251_01695 [Elusimicrobia bacterium RIFOXYA2_FULL_47_53]OGS25855.1 MAG: hypothetical protein A2339_03585 [Elusimicrobia bacterium RIFOXYB12_FULL_50_12]OGS31478.1 MAG: hypothetical protein